MRIASLIRTVTLTCSLTACGGGGGVGTALPTAPIATPTPTATPQGWKLVWSDEFNGATLDTTKWSYDVGGDGWGNNEVEYYTAGSNITIANGYASIVARKENVGGRNYTSTRMITKGKFFFAYGKAEARIKLPHGQGMWPAFWMMGENIDTIGYPKCGEIDIMEMIGGKAPDGTNQDSVVWGSLHRPNEDINPASEVKSLTATYTNAGGANFSDDFHVFGVQWSPTTVSYYVDSTVYETIDISSNTDGYEVFKKPFFLLLNLAVGGDWPGPPDATTAWPQQMTIDWVRVYQE